MKRGFRQMKEQGCCWDTRGQKCMTGVRERKRPLGSHTLFQQAQPNSGHFKALISWGSQTNVLYSTSLYSGGLKHALIPPHLTNEISG